MRAWGSASNLTPVVVGRSALETAQGCRLPKAGMSISTSFDSIQQSMVCFLRTKRETQNRGSQIPPVALVPSKTCQLRRAEPPSGKAGLLPLCGSHRQQRVASERKILGLVIQTVSIHSIMATNAYIGLVASGHWLFQAPVLCCKESPSGLWMVGAASRDRSQHPLLADEHAAPFLVSCATRTAIPCCLAGLGVARYFTRANDGGQPNGAMNQPKRG